MSDIFKEVDEDVRRDQYEQLWRLYGRYVIGAAFAIIFGTAAGVFWQHYAEGQRQSASQDFESARVLLEGADKTVAAEAFAVVADQGRGVYRSLAALQEAAARLSAGDTQSALALYDRFANGTGEKVLRDYAALRAAMLLMDMPDRRDEARTRLTPLAGDESAWRFSAREFLAVLAQAAGDRATARTLYGQLARDAGAPAGIKARSMEMFAALEHLP